MACGAKSRARTRDERQSGGGTDGGCQRRHQYDRRVRAQCRHQLHRRVSLAAVDASGTVSLRAAEGAVRVSQDLRAGGGVDAAGRSVDLRSAGALAVRSATASAGNVALASGGNLDIAGATASGAVSAESGSVLGIGGTVNGSQISLSSRDIAVGPSAKIGTATGTSTIQITANGGNVPVVIGGSAAAARATASTAASSPPLPLVTSASARPAPPAACWSRASRCAVPVPATRILAAASLCRAGAISR
jgi:hypothetical protein